MRRVGSRHAAFDSLSGRSLSREPPSPFRHTFMTVRGTERETLRVQLHKREQEYREPY